MSHSYAYSGVQRDIELVSEVLTGVRSYCSTMSVGRVLQDLLKGSRIQRCAFLIKKRCALTDIIIVPALPLMEDTHGEHFIPEGVDIDIVVNGHSFTVCFLTRRHIRHVSVVSGPFAPGGHIVGSGPGRPERSYVSVL